MDAVKERRMEYPTYKKALQAVADTAVVVPHTHSRISTIRQTYIINRYASFHVLGNVKVLRCEKPVYAADINASRIELTTHDAESSCCVVPTDAISTCVYRFWKTGRNSMTDVVLSHLSI